MTTGTNHLYESETLPLNQRPSVEHSARLNTAAPGQGFLPNTHRRQDAWQRPGDQPPRTATGLLIPTELYSFRLGTAGAVEVRGQFFNPYPMRVNPSRERVTERNKAWVLKNEFFAKDSADYEKFCLADFSLLAALSGPDDPEEVLQLAADFNTWFFLLDNILDLQDSRYRENQQEARELIIVLTDVLFGRAPSIRISGQDYAPKLCQTLTEIRTRLLQLRTPELDLSPFVYSMKKYFDALFLEAQLQGQAAPPSVAEYRALRQHTIGLYPSFEFNWLANGVVIGPQIREHKLFKSLMHTANVSVSFVNDIISHPDDVQQGSSFNLFAALQNDDPALHDDLATCEKACSIANQAMRVHRVHQRKLLAAFPDATCVKLMLDWMVGNMYWHLQSKRYWINQS